MIKDSTNNIIGLAVDTKNSFVSNLTLNIGEEQSLHKTIDSENKHDLDEECVSDLEEDSDDDISAQVEGISKESVIEDNLISRDKSFSIIASVSELPDDTETAAEEDVEEHNSSFKDHKVDAKNPVVVNITINKTYSLKD